MPEEKVVSLKELLTDKEIEKVSEFLEKEDYKSLREFLKKRRKKLIEKGVLPEYLSYYLEYISKKKLEEVI